MIRTEYWREALKSGLRLEAKLGANPFKYGANGATDTHTGLATADEDNFWGKFKSVGAAAPTAGSRRDRRRQARRDRGWEQAAAGYMGVWATANTRAAHLGRDEAAGNLRHHRPAHDACASSAAMTSAMPISPIWSRPAIARACRWAAT